MKAKQFLMPMLLLGITSFYSMDRLPENRVPSSVHAFRLSDPVPVEGGRVRGVLNGQTGVTSYKGIPFAAPPTGSLRWKPPQAVLPWDGVRDCTRFGPSPMQMKPVSFFMIGPE
ncbi:MAG TPA: carboxylesterase family protein, partial [Puia sp.]|nr:carboxylesterase family protein [Puia sp.]